MSDNKQNDDFYDEILEDSFEDDFDADFVDDNDFEDENFNEPEFIEEPFEEGFVEDDFYSEDELNADADENWDEDSFNDDEEPFAGGEKKSKFNLSFNTIVIGLAVLLGLGIFGFQLTKSQPTNAPSNRYQSSLSLQGATEGTIFGEAEAENTAQPNNSDANIPQNDTATSQGFLYETDALDAVKVELDDAPPMPAPVVSAEMPVAQAELPTLSNIEIPRPPVQEESVTEEVAVSEPLAEEVVLFDEQDQSSLLIDDEMDVQTTMIESAPEIVPEIVSLEEIPLVTSEVMEEVTFAPEVVSSATDELILQRLETIMGRLDNMENEISRVNSAAQNRVQALERQLQSIKSSRSSSNAIVAAPPKERQLSQPVARNKANVRSASNVSWELRAAQPGKAWVSKKGQQSLKPVIVGDSLDGIGRITAISYQSNKWIVQGTTGKIRQ